MTRKIIRVVLEQGVKFGLNVAGGFLGPAWPFVRPLIEKLIDDLPKEIAGKYKSSREAVEQAMSEIQNREKEIAEITEVLDRQGLTKEWTVQVLNFLDGFSDDLNEVLLQQSCQADKLDDILLTAKALHQKRAGRLVFRGERLEYVDYLTVPETFMPGFDLAPGTVITELFPGRHAPAGFFIWNFLLLNDGEQVAVVSEMEMIVKTESQFPDGSERGGVLPLIEAFEDEIWLKPGAASYPVFQGKHFKYAPEADVDSFRIRAVFQSNQELLQQLQLRIRWSDGTGDHFTYGTPLFLAAQVDPQLGVSRSKFGFGSKAGS